MSGLSKAEETARKLLHECMEISKTMIDPKDVPEIEHYMTPVFTHALYRAYREDITGAVRSGVEKHLAFTFLDFIRTFKRKS